jgi:hypothetical protein
LNCLRHCIENLGKSDENIFFRINTLKLPTYRRRFWSYGFLDGAVIAFLMEQKEETVTDVYEQLHPHKKK